MKTFSTVRFIQPQSGDIRKIERNYSVEISHLRELTDNDTSRFPNITLKLSHDEVLLINTTSGDALSVPLAEAFEHGVRISALI